MDVFAVPLGNLRIWDEHTGLLFFNAGLQSVFAAERTIGLPVGTCRTAKTAISPA